MERAELKAVPARAERLRWTIKAVPKTTSFLMPMDTYYVFEEARSCFIYGHFVATVMMATAFIEHWFAGKLHQRGFSKEANSGLAAAIACARNQQLIVPAVLDRIDKLRLIRNPFAHLKEMNHEHGLGARTVSQGRHPDEVLEQDAKEALSLMYTIALYPLRDA